LLCIARAREGGESDIVSSHHVWNTLQKERPDVAETLTKPIWYFDRKGETSDGEEPYIRTSVFYIEKGANGRVYSKWDPYYVKSLDRFMNAGVIPHLSAERMYNLKLPSNMNVGEFLDIITFRFPAIPEHFVMRGRSIYQSSKTDFKTVQNLKPPKYWKRLATNFDCI
jgi:hypothetical protein